MRRWWEREWLSWITIGGMLLASALFWARVPERMPVHWGIDGTPDRYGGRAEGLLLLPLLALALYGGLRILPRFDPRRDNYAQFAGPYATIRITTMILLAAIHGVVIASALGSTLNMTRVVSLALGAMFVIIGNLMGKLRQSWFVGIRTPWTLSSARSWGKTHRLGGWVFIAGGVVFAIAGLLDSPALLLAGLGGFFVALIGVIVYSYLVWRDDPGRPTGHSQAADPTRS